MWGCQSQGIIRKNGFLYLDSIKPYFRSVGDIKRDISQIAPEELAAGMMAILKQNDNADKNGLYRTLALYCGTNRLGQNTIVYFDRALTLIRDQITVKDDMVSINKESEAN
jgi:ABC-type Fe2+-enterobactin transport system substrate-binding protein